MTDAPSLKPLSDEWRDIGANLARLRVGANMTQQLLANAVGIRRDGLARSEAGARVIDLLEAGRLANALGVALADLLPTQTTVVAPKSTPIKGARSSRLGTQLPSGIS